MQHAGLHVEASLQQRRAVDGVRGCPCRSQGGLGLGHVGECVVDARLEQVHFGQDHLVVELFEFAEKGVDEGEGVFVVLVVDVAAAMADPSADRYDSVLWTKRTEQQGGSRGSA